MCSAARPNQLDRQRDDVDVTADELLDVAATPGEVTEQGLRGNISVGLRYLESWLRGNGAAAINNLMEDAATAEISRSQIWQWVHNAVRARRRRGGHAELVEALVESEYAGPPATAGRGVRSRAVADSRGRCSSEVALADDFVDFLTLPAYDLVVAQEGA